jgi:UDP-N-acetyl-D-mannosaminuronic acid dehydrogenase
MEENQKSLIMGLAFKPNIDDLTRKSSQIYRTKVMQSEQNGFMIVEPNISEHSVFRLTDYQEAYDKADIVAFLLLIMNLKH